MFQFLEATNIYTSTSQRQVGSLRTLVSE